MTIKKLLLSLLEHKVQFVVIGAWALPAHGYKRFTGDIDLFIKPTRTNALRTMKALRAIGYHVIQDMNADIFLKTKVLIRQYVLETDIHPFVKGTTYEECWKNKIETEIEGVKVYVPSLQNMIKMKKAAGRDKDKLDLELLKEIERQLKQKK